MHSVWKGAITFGLVHIPVRLYHASIEKELKFRLLHKKDLGEIRYARICKSDGKEVPWEEIVKGFETGDGRYVVMTEEDFEKANPKRTKNIEILDFTEEDQVDIVYHKVPYFLEPEKGAVKAYILLREALRRSKKVAIGTFVFRNREHIGMIKAFGDVLMLVQLRYQSEVLPSEEVRVPREKVNKRELDIALKFIDQMTRKFNPKEYTDHYAAEVKAILRQKGKGKKVKAAKGKSEPSPKVQDITSLLKASLHEPKKRRKSA